MAGVGIGARTASAAATATHRVGTSARVAIGAARGAVSATTAAADRIGRVAVAAAGRTPAATAAAADRIGGIAVAAARRPPAAPAATADRIGGIAVAAARRASATPPAAARIAVAAGVGIAAAALRGGFVGDDSDGGSTDQGAARDAAQEGAPAELTSGFHGYSPLVRTAPRPRQPRLESEHPDVSQSK